MPSRVGVEYVSAEYDDELLIRVWQYSVAVVVTTDDAFHIPTTYKVYCHTAPTITVQPWGCSLRYRN